MPIFITFLPCLEVVSDKFRDPSGSRPIPGDLGLETETRDISRDLRPPTLIWTVI